MDFGQKLVFAMPCLVSMTVFITIPADGAVAAHAQTHQSYTTLKPNEKKVHPSPKPYQNIAHHPPLVGGSKVILVTPPQTKRLVIPYL